MVEIDPTNPTIAWLSSNAKALELDEITQKILAEKISDAAAAVEARETAELETARVHAERGNERQSLAAAAARHEELLGQIEVRLKPVKLLLEQLEQERVALIARETSAALADKSLKAIMPQIDFEALIKSLETKRPDSEEYSSDEMDAFNTAIEALKSDTATMSPTQFEAVVDLVFEDIDTWDLSGTEYQDSAVQVLASLQQVAEHYVVSESKHDEIIASLEKLAERFLPEGTTRADADDEIDRLRSLRWGLAAVESTTVARIQKMLQELGKAIDQGNVHYNERKSETGEPVLCPEDQLVQIRTALGGDYTTTKTEDAVQLASENQAIFGPQSVSRNRTRNPKTARRSQN